MCIHYEHAFLVYTLSRMLRLEIFFKQVEFSFWSILPLVEGSSGGELVRVSLDSGGSANRKSISSPLLEAVIILFLMDQIQNQINSASF